MQHISYLLLTISGGINELVAAAAQAAANHARNRMAVADAARACMCETRRQQGR